MDRKSFDKLKNSTVICVVIQSIISIVEYMIEPPFKSLVKADTTITDNLFMKIFWTGLYCAIVVCVIMKEHSCLNAFFMVLNVLSSVLGVVLVILIPILIPEERYASYIIMHIFVALVNLTTAGFMVAYYRKIRLVRKIGFEVQPTVSNSHQDMNYKATDASFIP